MAPARLVHYERDPDRPGRTLALNRPGKGSVAEALAEHDIVVTCILQDTDNPLIFVSNAELDLFRSGTLFIDVSCDEAMGFEWARPTSFADPMLTLAGGAHYYAVDHSPSYLWNSATWEISEAVIPYLGTVMSGEDAWDADLTVGRAIEIRAGVVENPKDPELPVALLHVPLPQAADLAHPSDAGNAPRGHQAGDGTRADRPPESLVKRVVLAVQSGALPG